MIRELNENDKAKVIKYLIAEPALNLFMLGDIENYGFNNVDFQRLWGEFDNQGKIKSVLLRYYDNNIIYSRGDYNVEKISEVIKANNPKMLTGKKESVQKLDSFLEISNKRDTYFTKLNKAKELYKGNLLNKVKKTRVKEVKYLWELHKRIKEFDDLESLERKEKKYKDKTGRGYHILNEKGNKAISCAETTAENSYSAMIIGVATDPDYRNKGLASAVMSKLCKEVLKEGKELCLFYDNPKAGKIYKRIGFEDIGIWSMWKLKREK
ncbi:MAG: GNAT family N-acetyltransferase [Halanaerobiales bacterium]|nr:GNAT family N-acetyltransferase [Halanaerobiales bacterium]